MDVPDEIREHRVPAHPIHSLIRSRWSPRAMAGEPLTREQISSLFEAARWAPSSFNEQPWRFLYATRDGPHWALFLGLLTEKNRAWCKDAGALLMILSARTYMRNGKENASHSFSAGSAFENLALQATALGLASHAMGGFDKERARVELSVPDGYAIEAMVAVGRRAPTDRLPEELKAREIPSGRRPLEESAWEGGFEK